MVLSVQDEDLVLVALETLKGVEKIFKNNKASVTWDREKVSRFTNLINRQVEKLQECVSQIFPALALVLTLQGKCSRTSAPVWSE